MATKNHLFFLLVAAIGLTAFVPLAAKADPQANYCRGECGNGKVRTDYVAERDRGVFFQGSDDGEPGVGTVLQCIIPAGIIGIESRTGLSTKITGLRPLTKFAKRQKNSVGWQSLTFRIGYIPSPSHVNPNNIFVKLHFDLGPGQSNVLKVLRVSDIPGGGSSSSGWHTITLRNQDIGGFGQNGLLKQVDIYLSRFSIALQEGIKVGKVEVVHGEGGLDKDDSNILVKRISVCD